MKTAKPRILAIDDTPANLAVLTAVLGKDFELQVATSGTEGIAMAAAQAPDVILLDIMMPGIDGFETCRRLKADSQLCQIPVVFLTALSDQGAEMEGLSLGAIEYITKPFASELVKQRMRNILQMRQLDRDLKASEERFRYVMEATGEGIWDWDIPTDRVDHNASWCNMLGGDLSLMQHPMREFITRVHPDDLQAVQTSLERCLRGEAAFRAEYRLRRRDGGYVWVADRGNVVQRDARNNPLRMVGSIRNITQRKEDEAEIFRLAFYDALTELPNRRLLIDRLKQSQLNKKRKPSQGVLMFIDMDRFKHLNDAHGHALGDQMLIEVAQRLRRCVREDDTVARFGGDEFVVMLDHFSGPPEGVQRDAQFVGQKILDALSQPYDLSGVSYCSTASLGVALFGAGEASGVDQVLHEADVAMYAAKAEGGNTVCFYQPGRIPN